MAALRALASVLALMAAWATTPVRADVPVLVELFTSEGCSSCPPADALLARLVDEHAAGVRVVALSEHVDYWDDLGWRDRFSSPVFTRRQETYVRRLRSSAIYTPQLVVAGRTQMLGSDARAVRTAIAAAAREPSGQITARIVHGGGRNLTVALDATWSAGVPADVLVAVVQDHATSRITGGENAGRTLDHVAVVRWLAVVGSGAGAFSGSASVERETLGGQLVAFVQECGGGPVHAVTTVALP